MLTHASKYTFTVFFSKCSQWSKRQFSMNKDKNYQEICTDCQPGVWPGISMALERVLSKTRECVLFSEPSKVQSHYFQCAQAPSHTGGIFIMLISLSFVFCLQWLLFQIKNPVFFSHWEQGFVFHSIFNSSCCEGKPPVGSHCAGAGCVLAWVPTKRC